MDTCMDKVKQLACDLLEKGEVDQVVGFTNGTLPMATRPVSIRSKDEIDKLAFNSFCGLNLANYVRQQKGKTAVIAKGCDSRNIVTHIVENQVKRDEIYVIGIPCTGMVDKAKLAQKVEDDITAVSEENGKLIVTTASKTETIDKKEVLKSNCMYCTHPNPEICDVMAADPVEVPELDNAFADVDEIAALEPEERWVHFEDLLSNCIRCYACRNACPLCYCPTCFVDESGPQWVGKGQNKTDVLTFHFLRAYHCAGRCTDCGACVEACPMGINVRDFTRKLNKDALDLFGWEAGCDPEKRPPLDAFSPDDPNDFIK